MERIFFYLGIFTTFYLGITPASAQAPSISYSPTANVFTVGSAITALNPTNSGGAIPATNFATVSTLVAANTINGPFAMVTDVTGNVYVADYGNNKIRKITAAGVVSTLAGSGVGSELDGTGAAATFNGPDGLAYDGAGNLYVADANGNKIRKIVIATGAVTTIAGTGTAGHLNGATVLTSTFNAPDGLAIDGSGNLFIADFSNNSIREISAGGVVSTLAGGGATGTQSGSSNGTGTAALFNTPIDLTYDGAGNLFVADYANNLIRQIVISTGVVTTFAGSGTAAFLDGTGTAAAFSAPSSICNDASGNFVVADQNNNRIRLISPAGVVTTIAGSGTAAETNGVGTAAAFYYPVAIAVDKSGNCYVGDWTTANNGTIRKVLLTGYTVSPALPAGLSLTSSSGQIAGTPTALSSSTNYKITGYNGSGSSNATISIQCVQTNNWTAGANTTAWGTAGNWSKGAVPGANDNIQIGVTAYTNNQQPTLSATTTVNSITFGAVKQGVLTIATGNTLTINSNLTVNTGATGATITGAGTAAVNIAPGAKVAINGTGVLTLTSPLSFTLQSSAAGDASIGQITSTNFTGTATSSINVQRYLTGGAAKYRGFRLISSPVTSGSGDYTINYLKNSIYLTSTITTGGFDNVVAANPTIYLYRENLTNPSSTTFTGSNFRGINNISTTPLYGMNDATYPTTNIPVGNGILCFFRGDRNIGQTFAQETVTTYIPTSTTLTTSGTLNVGNITVKDWFTPSSSNLSYTAASPYAGFNLVGNPYASAIDWDTFQSTSIASGGIYGTFINSNTMYILDPSSHNYGAYTAGTGGVGTNNATNIISSGQGFFVKATSASAQLVFTESAKTSSQNTGTNLTMGRPVNLASNPYFRLRLAKDSVNADETMVRFNNQATTNFDEKLDAIYRQGYGSVSLAGMTSDKVNFAIGTVPLPGQQSESIALNVNANTDGIYSLSLKDISAVPRLFDVWLMDAYKKDSLEMRQNKTYNFNIYKKDSASFGPKRFTLVIRQNAAYAYQLLNFTAAKVPDVRQVQITWNTINEGNYTNFTVERSIDGGKTFDVLGGVTATAASEYTITDKSPVSGQNLYRLKQEDINNKTTYSNIVPIAYSNQSNSLVRNNISIYPNPAKTVINLTVTNAVNAPESYTMFITNSFGIVVKQANFQQANWQTNVADLLPGTYLINVLSNKDQKTVGIIKLLKI